VRAVDRPSGVRVRHAESLRIAEEQPPAGRRRRTRGAPLFPTAGPEAARELEPLLDAFREQRMEVVDRVPLEPVGAPRRRGAVAPLELTVPLGPGEKAVVLVERDGLYTWELPSAPARAARARRGAAPTPAVATFRIELPPPEPPAAAARRGVIGDFVRGRVQAIVLRFIARAAVDKGIAWLERDVPTGLVAIEGPDPKAWRAIDSLADTGLPRGRPARVLLAVHGTFSSTAGGFGGLGAHPWGQELLSAAAQAYDAVVGYDHRTLSVDPLANATDLLQRLRTDTAHHPPQFDVIAHSRGGLVARSLTEHLLPREPAWPAQVRRIVLVACTNGGTLFASPRRWKTYVDLYTNLAVAASRLVDLVAPPLAGTITREAVRGVGALVKYLVDAALDPADVPGLAAMDPDGAFVRDLNLTQEGQPTPERSEMYVVSSDFEVGGVQSGARELPPALLTFVGDKVVDAVFGKAANDLVVDVASMGRIDPDAGQFVDDRLDFGVNGSVYHCNYFLREELARALGRWLDLTPAVPEVVVRAPRMPARVVTDVLRVSSEGEVGALRAMLRERSSPFVVVSRPQREGGYHYAFRHAELVDSLRRVSARAGIAEALELRESSASRPVDAPDVLLEAVAPASAPPPPAPPGAPMSARRGVVMAGGDVAGVIPAPGVPETAEVLERPRAQPTPRARPAIGPAHVHADMPPEVRVGKVASITVELSGRPLARRRGATSRGGVIDAPDPDRPLTVQVLARENIEVVGDDRIDVPIPGPDDTPPPLVFDVRGVSAGPGEVWVLVRQGHPTLLLLKLTPKVVGGAVQGPAVRLSADGTVAGSGAAGWAIPTLRVDERVTGAGVIFNFELDLLEGGVHRFETPPQPGDRDAFVRGIYKDLENRWLANEDDVRAFLRDVRGYGMELFGRLLPTELQRLLWKNRSTLRQIRVLSTEPFVPWELMHLRSPDAQRPPSEVMFLGQMGLVRWLVNSTGPATGLRARKVRYVIPDYPDPWRLDEPADEREFLQTTFGAKAVVPHSEPIFKVLGKPGAFDILHFAGHGVATGGELSDAKVMLEGRVDSGQYLEEYLLASTVRHESYLGRPDNAVRPLVFLNACQVGRLGHQLSSLGGFADSFINAGAGAFVSSLWNVGDEPAAAFGRTFYERLKAGGTVADATVTAREQARVAGDATWLAYVVYAHPDARLHDARGG